MRTGLMLAGLVLAMGGLVGCGEDEPSAAGGLPRDASTEDFCANVEEFAQSMGAAMLADPDSSEAVTIMQDMAEAMRETGVPESATDEEVEGLELTLDAIEKIEADASLDDLGDLGASFSEGEQEKAASFEDYLDQECGDVG